VRREVPAHEAEVSASHALLCAVAAACALLAVAGCDRGKSRAEEQSAIAAAVDQARHEQDEADRALSERAIAGELARREAEQAEIDQAASLQEEREATIARLEERLRAALVDPASMQIRNAHLASDGETLCTEFNAKTKQGAYLGFRRAVVSDTVLSLEQDPDDNFREPQHRFAAIARTTGCY
jgi:hypothetical protein